MWAPMWTFTTSSFARVCDDNGSELFYRIGRFRGLDSCQKAALRRTHARGEKWATQLFTLMDVGNARPLIKTRSVKNVRKDRILQKRTFQDLDTLYRFIPYGSSTLFDELVSLDTDVEDFGTLDT
jgi:hypothetical protein